MESEQKKLSINEILEKTGNKKYALIEIRLLKEEYLKDRIVSHDIYVASYEYLEGRLCCINNELNYELTNDEVFVRFVEWGENKDCLTAWIIEN